MHSFFCTLEDGIKTKAELRSTTSAHTATQSTIDYGGSVLNSIDFDVIMQSSRLLRTGRRWGAIQTRQRCISQNVCLFCIQRPHGNLKTIIIYSKGVVNYFCLAGNALGT